MISPIREEVLSHGWLTEEQLLRFIAVSESTPGPIAVNVDLYRFLTGRIFRRACRHLRGSPAVISCILLIAALLKKVMKYAGAQAALNGIRPVIIGLILGTALILLLSAVVHIQTMLCSTAAM